MTEHPLLVTCAPGIEDLLEREMRKIGLAPGTRVKGGVFTEGDDEKMWRACLELRTASRIQRLIYRLILPWACALCEASRCRKRGSRCARLGAAR